MTKLSKIRPLFSLTPSSSTKHELSSKRPFPTNTNLVSKHLQLQRKSGPPWNNATPPHLAKTNCVSNLNSWISANHDRIQSINTFKSTVPFSHWCSLSSNLNVASTLPKSIATFFARFRILIFLAKIGRASLPSSVNLGSPPPKNSYIRTHERTIIRIFNHILRNNLPKTPKSLRYATRLKPIVLAIAISTSLRTTATYATIVAISIVTTPVPDCAQHHRATISGATTTIDVLATALPTAKPNSWTRNTFDSNNRSHNNFHLTMSRL